jgi:hypothetical protein
MIYPRGQKRVAHITTGIGISRYAAPSTGAFDGNSPQGDAGRHRVDRGPVMALLATLVKYPQGTKARSTGHKRHLGRLFSFRLHGEPAPLYRACRS